MKKVILRVAVIVTMGLTSCKNEAKQETGTTTTEVSKEMMIDLQSGFKVAWLIPIYKRVPKEYYFN